MTAPLPTCLRRLLIALAVFISGLATLHAQSFTVTPTEITVASVDSSFSDTYNSRGVATLNLHSSATSFHAGNLTIQSDKPWVTTIPSSSSSRALTVTAERLYQGPPDTAILTIRSSNTTRKVTVRREVHRETGTPLKLIHDCARNRLLALGPTRVVAYDATTQESVGASNLTYGQVGGIQLKDLALTPDGTELMLLASLSDIIVLDASTLAYKHSRRVSAFAWWGQWSPAPNGDFYASTDNVVQLRDGISGSTRATLVELDKGLPWELRRSVRAYALSPDQTVLWVRSRGPQNQPDRFLRFRRQTDGTYLPDTIELTLAPHFRETFSSDHVWSGDGRVLAMDSIILDDALSDNVVMRVLPARVLSLSHDGRLAATKSGVVHTASGESILTFPTDTSSPSFVSHPLFLGEDPRLLVHRLTGPNNLRGFARIDLSSTFANTRAGAHRQPESGAVARANTSLGWHPVPFARAYRIYASTDAASLDASTPDAATFIGETTSSGITPAAGRFEAGSTYHWRIDTVFADRVVRGPVASFHAATVGIAGTPYTTSTVSGAARRDNTWEISTLHPESTWTLTSDDPAISFSPTSGQGPATVRASVDARLLAPGRHYSRFTLSMSEGRTLTLPIEINVDPVAITHLRAAPTIDPIYALNHVPPGSSGLATSTHLLRLDPATRTITHAQPLEPTATDLVIHRYDRRLYVAFQTHNLLRAYDLETLAPIGTLSAHHPDDKEASRDVQLFAAGPDALLVYRNNPYGIGRFLNTRSGVLSYETYNGHGSMAIHPNGSKLFALEGWSYPDYQGFITGVTSSGLGYPGPIVIGENATTGFPDATYAGNRRFFTTTSDTPRLVTVGRIFDEQFKQIASLDDNLVAASADANMVFGRKIAHLAPDHQDLRYLPDTTDLRLYHDPSGTLVSFSTTSGLTFLDPAALPPATPPTLRVASANEDSVTFAWDAPEHLRTTSGEWPPIQLQVRAPGASAWTKPSDRELMGTTYRIGSPETGMEFRFRFVDRSPLSPWSEPFLASSGPLPPSFGSYPPFTSKRFVKPGSAISIHLPFSGKDLGFRFGTLPEGVRYDAATQSLVGIPQTPGRHVIAVTAFNSSGSRTISVTLVVADIEAIRHLPQARYTGLLDLDGGPLAGAWTLTRTGDAVSGTYRSVVFTRPFRARFIPMSREVTPNDLRVTNTTVSYLGVPVSLVIIWDIITDRITVKASTRDLEENFTASTLAETGTPTHWHAKTLPYPRQAYYTGVLLADAANGEGPLLPDGIGFFTLTTKADGLATLVGETALGQKFTQAAPLSNIHALPLFQSSPRDGSLLYGGLDILADTPAAPRVAGSMAWFQDAAPKAKFYREGFAQELLVAAAPLPAGGKKLPPLAPLANDTNRAELNLSGGGLDRLSPLPLATDLSLTNTNVVAAKPGTPANPDRVAVQFNARTGAVTGSAVIKNTASPKTLHTVRFRGMFVRDLLGDGEDFVGGYFLLPDATGQLRSGGLSITEPSPEAETFSTPTITP